VERKKGIALLVGERRASDPCVGRGGEVIKEVLKNSGVEKGKRTKPGLLGIVGWASL